LCVVLSSFFSCLHSFPTRRSSVLSVLCSLSLFSVLCSLFSVRCSLFSVRCSLFSVRCHCSLFSVLYSLFAVRCHCSLFTVLCSLDRKSTRLNSSHVQISYAVFCLI